MAGKNFIVFLSVFSLRPQVKSGTIFDNILITDDAGYAKKHAEQTWKITAQGEKKMKDKQDEVERKRVEEEEKKKKDEETKKEDEKKEEETKKEEEKKEV